MNQTRPTISQDEQNAEPGASKSPLAPAPGLKQYFETEADRRDRTREMFDGGASGYDKAEWLTGLGVGPWYRRHVLKNMGLKPGQAVLDVAIGTGLVAQEIQKLIQPGGELVGLDPSPGMLAEAKRKLDIETIEGYAESIPLPDDRFDALTMGYALRHVSRLDAAFAEYLRVLKPGGQACLMEIARPEGKLKRFFAKLYIRNVVPLLARLSGEKKAVARLWRYYWETIDVCVDAEAIMQAMRDAGFEAVRCDQTMGLFREYHGTKPRSNADHPPTRSESQR
ncbi:MAG: class I SAM-dependent methyltransferase [Phycisphaeraceae bacterium]